MDSRIFYASTQDDALYPPDLLWDYLRFNLEPSIVWHHPMVTAGLWPWTHLERCEAMGGGELHLRLLESQSRSSIMFKERSGLVANANAALLTWRFASSRAETAYH